MEDGWKAQGENCKVWSGSQQLSVLACLWSCDPPVFLVLSTFMSGLTNAISCFAVSHTMAWYMSRLCCAGKPLHGITTKHKKEDFKLYLGIFWFWSSKLQSLKFDTVPGRAVPTACASPRAMLDTIPEHDWAGCKDGLAHLSSLWCWWQWNCGISGHDKPHHNLSCFSNTDAWAVESETIPTSPACSVDTWAPCTEPGQEQGTTGLWSCRSQPFPSQSFMQVSVDMPMASDKCRLRPTFKTKPVPLFLWFLLTQRGALGGAPELSGGGKPHPTWCHSLEPVSCLCVQERLGTGRAQPSSASGIPHSVLPKTMGRTETWVATRDMGGNRQPHRRNTRWSQGFIHSKWSSPTPFWGARAVPLPFTPPWQWSSARGAMPDSDAGTCPEPASDPTNTRGCWIIPPNPTEQLWGMQGEDEEIKYAINVWRIKLNYL